MNLRKQFSDFPKSLKVIKNEFYTYDPNSEFEEKLNYEYLTEDLLQLYLEKDCTTIDLGWYGDLSENKGCFKVYVIKNENWENPLEVVKSKSQAKISNELLRIIEQYNK